LGTGIDIIISTSPTAPTTIVDNSLRPQNKEAANEILAILQLASLGNWGPCWDRLANLDVVSSGSSRHPLINSEQNRSAWIPQVVPPHDAKGGATNPEGIMENLLSQRKLGLDQASRFPSRAICGIHNGAVVEDRPSDIVRWKEQKGMCHQEGLIFLQVDPTSIAGDPHEDLIHKWLHDDRHRGIICCRRLVTYAAYA
jgi:hypothetical protein